MPHVTSVGLDVHARSVSAAAFNLYTGEVIWLAISGHDRALRRKNPTISGDGVKGRRKGMSEKGKSHKAYPPEFKSKCVRSMTLRTRCGHQDGHVRNVSAPCPRAGGHGVRSRAPPAPLT